MQEPGRTVVAFVVALAAIALPLDRARADDTEPIRIELDAHAGCPDAAAFSGEVRARTARARVASENEAARTFSVRIEGAAKGGSRGKLTIRSLDGQSSIREVSGKTCAEVASALALISALAIDPRASTAATPPPVPPIPVGPPRPPPGPAPPTGPTALSGARPRGALLSSMPGDLLPPLALPLPIAADEAPPPPSTWRFSFGAELLALAGVSRGMSQGLSLYVDAASAEPGFWVPSLRLSVTRASSGDVRTTAGLASFRYTTLRGDVCPLRLGPEDIALRLCGTAEAGTLEGYGLVHEVRPWFSFGGLGRLQWVMLDMLQVDLFAGLNLPLIQDRFFFETPTADDPDEDVTIHEVTFASGLIGVGVGVRFP